LPRRGQAVAEGFERGPDSLDFQESDGQIMTSEA